MMAEKSVIALHMIALRGNGEGRASTPVPTVAALRQSTGLTTAPTQMSCRVLVALAPCRCSDGALTRPHYSPRCHVSGISRVLRDLLDNAVRHAKSCIEITVAASGDQVVLMVDDDGPGIPAADRTRVFDRFVRIDTDRSREGGGSGLGLAIVAEIVAAHSGTVGIDERPSGGTRVTVSLPAAD
jgi:signal transduction histidine kinase